MGEGMRNLNEATILGHVGNNPQARETRNGNKVATFSVATSYQKKNGDKETTWHSIECWNAVADAVMRFVRKGHPIMVKGRMRKEKWEREIDGGNIVERGVAVVIVATDCYFLSRERGE